MPRYPKSAAAGQTLFETVVAATGGDYTTLKAALDAGKTNIFIRDGTYDESAGDANIPDGATIIGASRENTILDYGAANYGIEIRGDTGVYSTGTVSTVNDDETVTGVGTTWTTNAAAGEFIEIPQASGNWVEIDTVTDNTHLELTEPWRGVAQSGETYKISAFHRNVLLHNFAIQGTTAVAERINLNFVSDSIIDNVSISDGKYAGIRGIRIENGCHHNTIKNCFIRSTTAAVYISTSAAHNIVVNNNLSNGQYGVHLGSTSKYNKILKNDVSRTDTAGIYIQGTHNLIHGNTILDCNAYPINCTNDNNIISGNLIDNSGNNGIRLSGADYVEVSNNNISSVTGVAVYASTVNYTIINNNTIQNCTDYGIQLNGNYNVVSGNLINDSGGTYAIYVDANYCSITGNVLRLASQNYTGIHLNNDADYNTITGNIVNNFTTGIDITAGTCDENVVVGNQLNGNGTTLDDNGTGTVSDHNAT